MVGWGRGGAFCQSSGKIDGGMGEGGAFCQSSGKTDVGMGGGGGGGGVHSAKAQVR